MNTDVIISLIKKEYSKGRLGSYKSSEKDLAWRSLQGLTECAGTNRSGNEYGRGHPGHILFCGLQFSLSQNRLYIRPCIVLAPGGLWTGWGRGSPPTEVQDGIGGEDAQDDEGSGNGYSHVLGGVGPEHVRIHGSSKSQEAADACDKPGWGEGNCGRVRGGLSNPARSNIIQRECCSSLGSEAGASERKPAFSDVLGLWAHQPPHFSARRSGLSSDVPSSEHVDLPTHSRPHPGHLLTSLL